MTLVFVWWASLLLCFSLLSILTNVVYSNKHDNIHEYESLQSKTDTSTTSNYGIDNNKIDMESNLHSCYRPNANSLLHLISLEEEMHIQTASILSEYEYKTIMNTKKNDTHETVNKRDSMPPCENYDLRCMSDFSLKQQLLKYIDTQTQDPIYRLFHNIPKTNPSADCHISIEETNGITPTETKESVKDDSKTCDTFYGKYLNSPHFPAYSAMNQLLDR